MCIIALKPAKVSFSKKQLKTMWDANPHGAGFMFAEDGKVKVVKGLMTLEALWDAIQTVGPLRKLVIHFRIRTHGAQSAELTHPFWIREGKLGMVHNGVIRALVNETSDAESDTAVFARKLSEAYSNPLAAVRNPFHRDMLEAYIGMSKMVFMEGDGTTYILNEHMGEWSKNVWYSNDRYKEVKRLGYTSTQTSSGNWVESMPWRGQSDDKTPPYAYKLPGSSKVPETSAFPISNPSGKSSDSKAKGSGTTKGGSENAGRAVQKALMSLPAQGAKTSWDRLPFPEEAARRVNAG